jgi:hypothetical protein
VTESSWRYGRITNGASPAPGEQIDVAERPKLHYHRSGIVRVTLTGSDLTYRAVRHGSIPLHVRAQLISVITVRPWGLATADGDRKGDVWAIEPKWPQRIAFSFSIVAIPKGVKHRAEIVGELSPMGMLAGDPTRFVVDASGHDLDAVVIGRISMTTRRETKIWSRAQASSPMGTTKLALPLVSGSCRRSRTRTAPMCSRRMWCSPSWKVV